METLNKEFWEKRMCDDYRRRTGKDAESFCVL